MGAAVLALPAGAARAEDEPRTVLELSVGGAPIDRGVESGKYDLSADLSLRVRAGPVELGPIVAFAEGRGAVVSESLRLGGAAAYARSIHPFRFTLRAEAGVRRVVDVHEARYETPGPSLGGWGIEQRGSVMLPYAGLRAGIALRQKYEPSWTNLWSRLSMCGVSLFVRRDLSTGTAVVDYVEWHILHASPATTVAYRVGGWSAGLAVDLASGW